MVGWSWMGGWALFLLDVAANDWRSSLTVFEFGIILSVLVGGWRAGIAPYRAGSVWRSDIVLRVDGGFSKEIWYL